MEIVFENELFWYIRQADTRVLAAIERGFQVEVGNIEGVETRVAARQDTVYKDLDEFQGDSGCANIPSIENVITTYGDTSLVGVRFLGLDLAYYFSVVDFFSAFSRNVFEPDDK